VQIHKKVQKKNQLQTGVDSNCRRRVVRAPRDTAMLQAPVFFLFYRCSALSLVLSLSLLRDGARELAISELCWARAKCSTNCLTTERELVLEEEEGEEEDPKHRL
jgi:hypothetical protein